MDAQTRFRTQLVGALPAVVHYFDELDLAATIDELVPWEGDVPLGTLVEVLVANRLLHPKALFRIGPWALHARRRKPRGGIGEIGTECCLRVRFGFRHGCPVYVDVRAHESPRQ